MDGCDQMTTIDPGAAAFEADAAEAALTLRFWGVRGSIPCAGRDTLRYGGNTACVEVRAGGRVIVLDGGSGMRYLGNALMGEAPDGGDVLLTHCHFDHVCGLPFFAPFFAPDQSWRLWSGHLGGAMTTREMMAGFMRPPYFPVPPEIFQAQIDFRDFRAGDRFALAPGVEVSTAKLNHPDGAVGYRIEHRGRAVCYVTDTEHVPAGLDPNVLALARGADVLIYDASYTEAEYPRVAGRGHSTWEEGLRLADAAGVATYVAYHHEPDHDDAFLDGVAVELGKRRPGSLMAREGLTLHL